MRGRGFINPLQCYLVEVKFMALLNPLHFFGWVGGKMLKHV